MAPVTDHPCEVCGRPQGDDATFCAACAHLLDASLADVCAYHGLAYDLDIAITRQARIGSRDGSRPATAPMPYDDRAAKTAEHLRGVLASWALLVIQETRADAPADQTLTGLAAWFRARVGWLRHHVAGAEAHDEITTAVRAARRVCDRPADRLYAGPCDCGTDLYGRLDASYVVCPGAECDAVWNVEDRRRWLLHSAEDVLATPLEISRALTRYAQPVTPSAIRGYVHRGQLSARGARTEGHREIPVYRLGDVLDILARQAERIGA
jgi:hypothetical protein